VTLAPAPDPAVDRAATAYDLPPGASPRRVTGRVLQVGDVAIKSFAPEQTPRARLEASILRHLAGGDGYRVQTIVRTRTGADLHLDEGGALLATRWEAGVHRDHRDIPPDVWWRLGASLGALHARLDAPGAPLPLAQLGDLVRSRDLAVERVSLLAHRDAAARRDDPVVPAALRLLDARLRLLDGHGVSELPPSRDRGLIHHDFNQHNYLFSDAPTPLVLDWERAIGAPRAYEVARTLSHLPVAWPEAARSFVDGYRTRRPLDPDDLAACADVALTEHAVKHWPVARWLAGEPDAGRRIEALAPVAVALADGAEGVVAFYRALGG
jgi:Ser/Thr protein kinase RdoA (MazF antagonist)